MPIDKQDYCFCELAPLYALDLLSTQERHWVEQQADESPDLAEELADYQSVAMVIPYSSPTLPLSSHLSHLKERLFQTLALDEPLDAPASAPVPGPFIALRAQDLTWQPHSSPGVTIAIVHTDLVKREVTGILRAAAGVRYPQHRHWGVEELFMLSGDLVIEDQVYGAGDYIRSLPGSSHAPYTHQGCEFFFRTSLDDEYPDRVTVAT